jgi:hypothetical protein
VTSKVLVPVTSALFTKARMAFPIIALAPFGLAIAAALPAPLSVSSLTGVMCAEDTKDAVSRPVELAGVNLPDRNSERFNGGPHFTRDIASLVAQLALLLHIVKYEGIDILLALVRRTVTEHQDVTALLEHRNNLRHVRRSCAQWHKADQSDKTNERSKSAHRIFLFFYAPPFLSAR